jgi:hypothetical protein
MKLILTLLTVCSALILFGGCDDSSSGSSNSSGGEFILDGYFNELDGTYITTYDSLTTGGSLLVREYDDLTASGIEAYRQALEINGFAAAMGGIAYASKLEDGIYYSWNALREKQDGTTISQWSKTAETTPDGWYTSLFGTPPAGCTLMPVEDDTYNAPYLCSAVTPTEVEAYIDTLSASDIGIECQQTASTAGTSQPNFYCEADSGEFIYSAFARGMSGGSGYTILMFAEGGGSGSGELVNGGSADILSGYFPGIAGSYIKLTSNDTVSVSGNKTVARKYLSFESAGATTDYAAALEADDFTYFFVPFYFKIDGEIRYSWNALNEREDSAIIRWDILDLSTLDAAWRTDNFEPNPAGCFTVYQMNGIYANLCQTVTSDITTAYKDTLITQGYDCVDMPVTGGTNPNYLCSKSSGSVIYTWFGRGISSGNGYTYLYFAE